MANFQHHKAYVILLALAAVFGLYASCLAYVPITDNFESYPVGLLNGNTNPLGPVWYSSGCEVQEDRVHTGSKAVWCDGAAAQLIGNNIDVSTNYGIYIYDPSDYTNPDFRFVIYDNNGTEINVLSYLPATGNVYCGNGSIQIIGTTSNTTWHLLEIRWNRLLQTTACGYDGNWGPDITAANSGWGSNWDQPINSIIFVEQNHTNIYVDDITGDFFIIKEPVPTTEWGNSTTSTAYWQANVPSFFGTSTSAIYTGMSGLTDLIMTPLISIFTNLGNLFNLAYAKANGIAAGVAITSLINIVNNVNQLGNFPILTIILILTIVNIGVWLFNITWKLIKIVH